MAISEIGRTTYRREEQLVGRVVCRGRVCSGGGLTVTHGMGMRKPLYTDETGGDGHHT